MRILAGRWADAPLTSPGGRVRPTAEHVRAAVFDAVGDISGARVLDLYAGTGAVGLEALSRGAAHADFVEDQAAALHALKANIAALRAKRSTRLFKRDAIRFIAGLGADAYDLAFADPPYGSRQADLVVEGWLRQPFSRILVVEHAEGHAVPPGGRRLELDGSALTLYGSGRSRLT